MKSIAAAELFAPFYQGEAIRDATLNQAISRDKAKFIGC